MEKSSTDFLKLAAAAEPIERKLRQIATADFPVRFNHVIESAQPFLVATIASKRHRDATIWVICPTVRKQELFFESVSNWNPNVAFLPEAEFAAVENILPDPEIAAERLALLSQIEKGSPSELIVTTRAALDQPAPRRGKLRSSSLEIRRGASLGMADLLNALSSAGYERVVQVTTRGQFAVRGGIVDIFSWQTMLPFRIEFFGDEIESLREFDLDTQTSVRRREEASILLSAADDTSGYVRDYIADDALVIELDPALERRAPATPATPIRLGPGKLIPPFHIRVSEAWDSASPDIPEEDFSGAFVECDIGEFAIGDFMLAETKRARFIARLKQWRDEHATVAIYFQTEGEIERFREIIPSDALADIDLLEGTLSRGFCFPAGNLVILSANELLGRFPIHGRRQLRRAERRNRAQIDFSELNEGELVVHLEHGIGRFLGLIEMPSATVVGQTHRLPAEKLTSEALALQKQKSAQEVLVLEFADEAKLYVPLEQAYLVSRYVGVGKKSPPLSSLADAKWARAKKNATASIFDYAGKMLALQAERQIHPGHAFGADTKWQAEFEHSFPYRETPDQLTAIIDTKADMERSQPMDRLICGDVGFGKTEVAIRGAFKTVMDGKQVAVLAPTTVLAQQHFETFRQRMLDYPIRIEMLSRFRSPGEQKKVLQLLRDGGVDIVIGTHRLISGDVSFKDLGLVVIDEEQRFGVLHKEKFKELFKLVDVLTLSATPIPRTLYLSLVGVKDMSTIETPPQNRLPVETVVCGYDERIIRDAINRELERQGQVFFLHNRVQTIEKIRDRIADLCPNARVEFGHGQMHSDELEAVMHRFVAGKIDVLVCTTIIESGLDIPNANTIIIDRADRFGLADLYQLRGRVGRAEHKAYAYLLLPRELMMVGAARKRISAIKQYSSLGAGFRVAMRDLEIRGAGSILGTAQSGHIIAVGFELYCQLLKQAVTQIKGQKARWRLEVDLRLDFVATNEAEFVGGAGRVSAFLPRSYINDTTLRIQAYRRIAEITTAEQLEGLIKEWRDRFGPFPEAVENLIIFTRIKLAAAKEDITRVETREDKLMLTRRGDFILVAGKFPRLVAPEIEKRLPEILELLRKL
ncbi:MAG: transcription-repair coupling factor [Verrucomicrobia bacterium]|nr:MAG: transcription-repair coupling factor [Verrucomicrobiota bacterium]